MTLFSVRMNVLFSFWYNGFYSAMQNLDGKAFWFMLFVFSVLATIHVARALINFYLQQAFLIRWRTWLTNSLIERWLDKQAYYRSQFVPESADNPDQRIQQDVESFVSSSLSLSMGLLDAVVSLFAFTIILWNLSGALALLGVEIPRAMVFMVYAYVIVATVFAVKIGRPLIALNFLNEKLNANFRYALVRLREYGESIAFFRGETVERNNLLTRFAGVIANMWAIVFRSLKFQGFNLAISQAAVVFPPSSSRRRACSADHARRRDADLAVLRPGAGRALLLPHLLRQLRRLPRGDQPAVRLPRFDGLGRATRQRTHRAGDAALRRERADGTKA